jgi:hypothetical protein
MLSIKEKEKESEPDIELDDISSDTSGLATIDWTPEHEEILIEWADKAMCYRWLHSKSHALYSYLNTWYTIPVIVLSTLTGTANFAQDRVPPDFQSYFVMIVGSLNILAGIITTIQQFLKITQLNEAHRVSSISWDKFYRNIKIELAKHPIERIQVNQMIKMSKEEYDRLMETSPSIPEDIIHEFKMKFNKTEAFLQIVKPEICDILVPTNDYRNPWFNDENKLKTHNESIQLKLTKENRIKKANETNSKMVTEFITLFKNLNNRQPMDTEIIDNLKDKIDMVTLQKIIDESKPLQITIN